MCRILYEERKGYRYITNLLFILLGCIYLIFILIIYIRLNFGIYFLLMSIIFASIQIIYTKNILLLSIISFTSFFMSIIISPYIVIKQTTSKQTTSKQTTSKQPTIRYKTSTILDDNKLESFDMYTNIELDDDNVSDKLSIYSDEL